MPRYKSTAEQIEAQSMPEPNSGCWLWLGTLSVFGYGTITAGGKTGQKTHRKAYEIAFGEIPKGMHVLHRCDTRCCVNPEHLFLGTNKDNVADKVAKDRQSRGCGTGRAKLTTEQVQAVRAAVGTTREIAARFGIGKSQAHLIKSGQSWRHLPTPNPG